MDEDRIWSMPKIRSNRLSFISSFGVNCRRRTFAVADESNKHFSIFSSEIKHEYDLPSITAFNENRQQATTIIKKQRQSMTKHQQHTPTNNNQQTTNKQHQTTTNNINNKQQFTSVRLKRAEKTCRTFLRSVQRQ